jgi:hypothetical protein
MDHAVVNALNRWIGEETGLLWNGKPRFCWQWAPDMVYWQTRLGKVWVMSYWGYPKWNELQWKEQFGDRVPYPEKGMYHALPETQLAIGRLPDFDLTQNYIWAMKVQMSTSQIQQEVDVKNEMEDWHRNETNQFRQMAQNDAPAFDNFNLHDGNKPHVVFGGLADKNIWTPESSVGQGASA